MSFWEIIIATTLAIALIINGVVILADYVARKSTEYMEIALDADRSGVPFRFITLFLLGIAVGVMLGRASLLYG